MDIFGIDFVRKKWYFFLQSYEAIMSKSIEKTMSKKIHGNGKGWVFSAKDFANSGSRSAVDLALHRLEHKGKIRRVIRGIYYYPKFSEILGHNLSADVDDIAHAIARK